MQIKLSKTAYAFLIFFIILAHSALRPTVSRAQELTLDEDTSLEKELSQEQPTTVTAPEAIPETAVGNKNKNTDMMDELDRLESQGAPKSITDENFIEVLPNEIPPDAISEVDLDSDGKRVEYIEQEYLMNGYSLGGTVFNHNYNIFAGMVINDTLEFDASKRTSDLQSMGIVGRYAILPYDKIGTDLNLTLATSLNHASANTTSITTVRGELNLGYAFRTSKNSAFYILGGLGYEFSKGTDIEEILNPGGSSVQLGGGFNIAKKINFEFMYSYITHALSNRYLENLANIAISNGASTVTYDANKGIVTSNMLSGRVIFSY